MSIVYWIMVVCTIFVSGVMLWRLLQILFLFARRTKTSAKARIVPDERLLKVTIIVPAYNEAKVIRKTLGTLQEIEYPDDKLEILIINPKSTDNTSQIANEIAQRSKRNIKVIDATNGFDVHGKPRALNYALKYAGGEVVIIYDADSLVDKMAVKFLISAMVEDPSLAMTFGTRKVLNPHGFFARLAYLESLSQQLLTETAPPKDGQNFLFSPGTNVAIRKSVIEKLGGWDDNALTEDFELSVRLHSHGYKIEYVPSAVSHEEVPEKASVWLTQRTRWARGGWQVFLKMSMQMKDSLKAKKVKFINIIVFYKLLEFYSPLFGLILEDALFILGIIEILFFGGMGIGFSLWLLFYIVLFLQLLACLAYNREISVKNIMASFVLYFYYQLWLVIAAKVICLELARSENKWEKTKRFTSVE